MKNRAGQSQDGHWRDQILVDLRHLFQGEKGSTLYGLSHALAVEVAVLDILSAPEYEFTTEVDTAVLRSAALLHDVGLAHRADKWSIDHFEHIRAGQELAAEILGQNPLFQDCPKRIRQVLDLIKHHDDTTYSFPTLTRDGRPIFADRVQRGHFLEASLLVLQEADSRIHAAGGCIVEASQEWQGRGVPIVADGNAPLATWRWMDSVVGNVRLVAKRVVVDARTRRGRQTAIDAYQRLEDHVREQCDLAGVGYEAEACPPAMRETSIERLAEKSFDLRIVAFHAWDELEHTLRSAPLLYDRAIHPYEQAEIQLRSVDLDALTPMALYVLRSRVEEVVELHDALMVTHCFGLWGLPGLLDFRYGNEEMQRLAPPVVEDYVEPTRPGNSRLLGLVDGLNRCTAARNLGLTSVRALVASKVRYPLVPLPVQWDEIRMYEDHDPPPSHMKRRFRYEALSDFPFDSFQTTVSVTEENFQYFFYRDWRSLGSRGRRGVP